VSGLQVFNNTPDETAFYRLTLEREGVQASMLMIQPTLTSFTFEGPPQPVLLDVASMRSDSPSAKTCLMQSCDLLALMVPLPQPVLVDVASMRSDSPSAETCSIQSCDLLAPMVLLVCLSF